MTALRIARAATLGGYFTLLVLLVLWVAWLSPPEQFPRALALLLFAGPLLFPLRGLLHGRPYTHAWSSFLALAYVAHGATETFGRTGDRMLPALELLAALIFFVGAVLYVRLGKHGEGKK